MAAVVPSMSCGCRQQAMQPVKEVLAMIDESGIGKMSYHDFYVSCGSQLLSLLRLVVWPLLTMPVCCKIYQQ